MKEALAIIAAVLAFVGNISYLKGVIKGTIHPHPYTWFIWSIVSMTTFFGGLVKGAGIGVLPTGVAEGFTIIIFLFSLKYLFPAKVSGTSGLRGGNGTITNLNERGEISDSKKVHHIRKVDNYFLAACIVGLIPWVLTKDPTISVVVVVIIDLIAFIPTLRKTWQHPDTEKPLLYAMNVGRHILTLFSLEAYNIATGLHSVVMICINTIMVAFIRRRKTGQ